MTLDGLIVVDEDCRDGLHQYCATYYCDCPCHGYPLPQCMCARCQDIKRGRSEMTASSTSSSSQLEQAPRAELERMRQLELNSMHEHIEMRTKAGTPNPETY